MKSLQKRSKLICSWKLLIWVEFLKNWTSKINEVLLGTCRRLLTVICMSSLFTHSSSSLPSLLGSFDWLAVLSLVRVMLQSFSLSLRTKFNTRQQKTDFVSYLNVRYHPAFKLTSIVSNLCGSEEELQACMVSISWALIACPFGLDNTSETLQPGNRLISIGATYTNRHTQLTQDFKILKWNTSVKFYW